MEKRLLVIAIISIFSLTKCLSQSVYYDVLRINSDIKFERSVTTGKVVLFPTVTNLTVFNSILIKYINSGNILKTDTSSSHILSRIKEDLSDNPFIEVASNQLSGELDNQTQKFKTVNFGGLGSLGGIDVTKFANAIADIMIDRAKQELTVAFFDRFKKFSQENPEFQILFPKTTSNLSNLLTHTYPQMLPALRNGFLDDLKLITYNLDDVLELPKYNELLRNFPEMRVAIRSLRLLHDLEAGTINLAEVICEFSEFPEFNPVVTSNSLNEFKNMGATLAFAALFSEALRTDSASFSKDSTIWVSPKEIRNLIADPISTQIFIGLLYQQVKNRDIEFFFELKPVKLTAILEREKDKIFVFQSKIAEFANLTDKFSVSYKEIKNKISKREKLTNENIHSYIGVSLDVLDYTFSILKIFDSQLIKDNYLTIPRKANGLYKDIYSEQYTQAVNDAVDILKEVHNLTSGNKKRDSVVKSKEEERKRMPADADFTNIDKELNLLKSTLKAVNDSLSKMITFIEKVKPYALFMANMVEAKDEEAVKAALENVILPVGSSSIKKSSHGNISVQTYLGAYWSTSNGTGSSTGAWADRFGVSAPIGISFTPGFQSWGRGGSLSYFASLFDLGAIVDYKLKKQDNVVQNNGTVDPNAVSKEYTIKLGQIFSPGIFLVYGFFGNLPLSLGYGFQYGPGLSKIDVSNSTVLSKPKVRWSFFLAVDMPFFTLKNRLKAK
ncbi:hypothetical protein [Dyadobacter pollutisoli]|uniref:Uncharacterized protein n=1 Tax=Dyadobacter pollutisoli TaxID=2910158 RepID=A0A9E8NE18_9BACT|nr:hypothetical protein [Dyadobacter pollutisoli]WAC12444.1 hypothetical protein ON006_00490 [Dyadobacter pollutisoli]